jgi:hypothetical protein
MKARLDQSEQGEHGRGGMTATGQIMSSLEDQGQVNLTCDEKPLKYSTDRI